ncbi:methyl-accepting chemotaxis protein [Isachenkonia alkalipeptolytica]|uniref:Methyl-accepting chemotaxis protein n=1 Tax=Isachenkonia alkalipeptolytica TaxID=2565777 RepID=A0AA43XIR6_9CLOT|nr:methyl-accepting chemotaxis protein [Isachenkonia alkalipeptolytica]NBG86964.1 methyl-accepting chemotaxis protein [Isachenkonia alkalipeptolytica]
MFGLHNKKIQALEEKVEQVANGDLTLRFDQRETKELGKLQASLGKLLSSVKKLVGNINGANEKNMIFTGEIESNTKQIFDASQEISQGVMDIATEATEQNEALGNMKRISETMSKDMEGVLRHSEKTEAMAKNTLKVVHTSTRLLEKIITSYKENGQWSEDLGKKMKSLESQANNIQRITGLVAGISDNTNLLALNASIEAARAGEMGKGFSVVAGEVKKLATESAEHSGDIEKIISEMVENTRKISEEIEGQNKKITGELTLVNQSKEELDLIVQSTEETAKAIGNIRSLAKNQFDLVERVKTSIDTIARAMEKTSVYSQEAASSSQEQTASLELIFEDIQKLGTMTKEVDQLVEGFVQDYKITEETRRVMEGGRKEINRIAQHSDVKKMKPGALRGLLMEAVEKNSLFQLISIMDKEGDLQGIAIKGTREQLQGNFKHRPYFKESIRGKAFTSKPYISDYSYQYCVTIALPIYDLDEKIIGIVMGDLLLE